MADITLRDRNGAKINYPGIDIIKLNTSGGDVQNYGAFDPETLTPDKLAAGVTVGGIEGTMTAPEIVENMPIALDFSGGNQSIVAPDGVAVKSAIIQKPETLTPENIAEGVNIAGILGTLAAGGGGKVNAITKFVTLAENKKNTTVELISATELTEAGITFPATAFCFALMFLPNRTYSMYDGFAEYSVYHIAYCFIANNDIAYSTSTGAFYGDLELYMSSSSGRQAISNTQLKKNYFGTANTNGLCYIDGAIKCAVNNNTYMRKNYIVVAGYVEKP